MTVHKEPHSNGESSESRTAPASPQDDASQLIQKLDHELVLKRSARAMRRQRRTLWRLMLIVVIAAILLFAAYAMLVLDRAARSGSRMSPVPGFSP